MRSRVVSLAVIVVVACLAATLPAQAPTSPQDQTDTIRRMLTQLHENGEFTGSVLVARAGTVIEAVQGLAGTVLATLDVQPVTGGAASESASNGLLVALPAE
ncbi:hypothetical protein LuPra_04552 [Luteitalea pratensis]|uniref:Serine hydrolase n=1 Tax=Luteitalea pratensis TaxID=1855912 RepID=A0A143PU28_LUTPR|nr:hypothetical protein [Luteitalea pratensis]AMY11304.1 hypothetical protein LuPra_04552 [Luteitalea pratensis]